MARDYAQRRWVRKRCENAQNNSLRFLRSFDESEPLHDQVTAWLFASGVTTHIVLVAGLRNPTVRQRYLAARELLADYGRLDFYEALLELLGCAQMSPEQVGRHLNALADAFDAAKVVTSTPFFFTSDISDAARPIAIDGSQEMIEPGFHRETVFWLVATWSRCQKVLFHDATVATRQRFDPGYRHMLSDLGIASTTDLRQRNERTREYLPMIPEVAQAIISANPGIED